MYDQEPTWTPTAEELEAERRYWQHLDRLAEYDAWIELQAKFHSDDDGDGEEWEEVA